MGLIEKAAHMMHSQHGWFMSDSLNDAPVGSKGTKDGDLFERLGDLKSLNMGVPDPILHSVSRTPRWFTDSGVTVGNWTVKGAVPGGLASLAVKLEFSSQYSVACFLSSYNEVNMTENLDKVGAALVDLYHKPGKAWKLNQKWVYTGLQVTSGFIVMSREKNTALTLSGQGQLNVSGVPIQINVDGFVSSASSSVEMVGLDNITPLLKLCEVYDPILAKAWWRQIG
jgi:hypothetical protein